MVVVVDAAPGGVDMLSVAATFGGTALLSHPGSRNPKCRTSYSRSVILLSLALAAELGCQH